MSRRDSCRASALSFIAAHAAVGSKLRPGTWRPRPQHSSTSAAVAGGAALAGARVALEMRELLHAAAVDRLAGIEVTLRVLCDRVQEGELLATACATHGCPSSRSWAF